MFRLFILDFDSIVLESVAMKIDALRALFAGEPEHTDEIGYFYIKNGSISRTGDRDAFRDAVNMETVPDLPVHSQYLEGHP